MTFTGTFLHARKSGVIVSPDHHDIFEHAEHLEGFHIYEEFNGMVRVLCREDTLVDAGLLVVQILNAGTAAFLFPTTTGVRRLKQLLETDYLLVLSDPNICEEVLHDVLTRDQRSLARRLRTGPTVALRTKDLRRLLQIEVATIARSSPDAAIRWGNPD